MPRLQERRETLQRRWWKEKEVEDGGSEGRGKGEGEEGEEDEWARGLT